MFCFFFKETATTEICTSRHPLSLHDALPILASRVADRPLTEAIAQFLDGQWRHYLTQTWLRDGADSARHRAAIALGDAMVQVDTDAARSEEHTSELQSLMRISYAVFCLKKKNQAATDITNKEEQANQD